MILGLLLPKMMMMTHNMTDHQGMFCQDEAAAVDVVRMVQPAVGMWTRQGSQQTTG